MDKKTILYRGDLKSCNYRCSYCPFSKHKASAVELERDRAHFARFCHSVEERAGELSIGAVLVVPYGEASLHDWYWEGLGCLAVVPDIDRVGMQTNLSFPVEKCLEQFGQQGAQRGKLCLWATFHPEMTDVDTFVAICHQLRELGVSLCVGGVGVPANIPLLVELRRKLSAAVYLWVNRMDGLGRNYTPEEVCIFTQIDPFFEKELQYPAAREEMCGNRCFVEADGRMRTCNISKGKAVNWYEADGQEIFRPLCGRKRCTCYLAYAGREDFGGKHFFGSYPLFRLPGESCCERSKQ